MRRRIQIWSMVGLMVVLVCACQSDRRGGAWSVGGDGGSDAGPGLDLGEPVSCGNGRIDEREVCDGEALGGATCEDFGYGECCWGLPGLLFWSRPTPMIRGLWFGQTRAVWSSL